jgi:tetratricopeptide (TPR) repeat protein
MASRRGVVLLGLAAAAAWADGGGGGGRSAASASAEFDRGVAAIRAERWADAIAALEPYLRRVRDDADAHNWLAYAYRRSGRLQPAFEHYRIALRLEPGHLGAHEYIGEAYIQAGQPDRAEFHLKELQRLCGDCEQARDLREALAKARR